MQTRALTIATVVPIMFVLGLQSKVHVMAMVWVGMLGSSIEWSGVKRHLKVELLLCDRDAATSPATTPPASRAPVTASAATVPAVVAATSTAHAAGGASAEGGAPSRRAQTRATPTTAAAASVPPSAAGAAAAVAPTTTTTATAALAFVDHPHEYARPVPPLTLYTVVKHVAWACLAFAGYHGEAAFVAATALYFLVFVTVTLTVHNRLEERVQQAVLLLSSQLSSRTRHSMALHKKDDDGDDVTDDGGGKSARACAATPATTPSWRYLWQHFRAMELFLVAQRQPTEQFLDFCLDIFGLVWLCGLVYPLLLYSVPGVGVPWVYSATISNFVNDICALLVGRAMRSYGALTHDDDDDDDGDAHRGAAARWGAAVGRLRRRCIVCGQQPLYRAISPNKSVGGAVAGVLGCAVTFTVCMLVAYVWVSPPPAHVIAPRYQSVPLWLLVGAAMGVMGVIGDLAQSLLKRSAHVKDAGFIIPGHGGMLDRVDGLLLVYPFMYCIVSLLRALSATS